MRALPAFASAKRAYQLQKRPNLIFSEPIAFQLFIEIFIIRGCHVFPHLFELTIINKAFFGFKKIKIRKKNSRALLNKKCQSAEFRRAKNTPLGKEPDMFLYIYIYI